MTTSNLFKHILLIRRITTFVFFLVTVAVPLSFLSSGPSFARDFKIPPKGYDNRNCHEKLNDCNPKCAGLENSGQCTSCCSRDWYWCLEAEGQAGTPGDALQPEDLAQYQKNCGETFDSKIQEKAIEGILK